MRQLVTCDDFGNVGTLVTMDIVNLLYAVDKYELLMPFEVGG